MRFPARRTQRGQTLVGMMVGVMISLITIAGMLVLYKTMIEVTGQASSDSLRDGQVASALLAAQMDVHEAGYGIALADVTPGLPEDPIDPERLTVIAQQAIAVSADDKRVVTWRSAVDGAAPSCTRLQIESTSDRAVRLLRRGPVACGSTASVGPDDWPAGTVLLANAGPWQRRDGSAVADAAAGSYLDMPADDGTSGFRVDTTALCTLPYAQQSADIQIRSPRLVLEKDGRELFSVCLSNIVATRIDTTPSAGGAAAGGSP